MKGYDPAVRKLIKERAGIQEYADGVAVRCEMCGYFDKFVQLHHRRPRGMGSSKRRDTNTAANGVALCMACHAWVEDFRLDAMKSGWLVPQHRDPSEIAVEMHDGWFLLTDDGEKYPVPDPQRGIPA